MHIYFKQYNAYVLKFKYIIHIYICKYIDIIHHLKYEFIIYEFIF